METIAQIFAIVGSAIGATWILSSKLTAIETALRNYGVRVEVLEAKVIKLEGRNRRR